MESINSGKFVRSSVTLTENITLDNTNADTVPANVVVESSIMTVDDNVTLTVGDDKTIIMDIHNTLDDRRINYS
tara:strand:+ start:609 stop:830 length:222 start_codon:yes stop_codon:yes gene_type:complete